MEYGDFEITVLADDTGFKARVRRLDRRHFTIAGNAHSHIHPFLFHGHVDTAIGYPTEGEAIENAKLIVDAARPETSLSGQK